MKVTPKGRWRLQRTVVERPKIFEMRHGLVWLLIVHHAVLPTRVARGISESQRSIWREAISSSGC
jgi:hypothetical protein